MNAANALAATLRLHGVDRIFCVPGESFLAVLDALHDVPEIQTIACRHEGGAGNMAVADAKLTGRPGVAFVSRGPGASNASIAVHTAQQDAAPLVLFIGQVDRADIGRRAFQEVDYVRTFGDMAKWVVEVTDGKQLPRIAAQALRMAAEGVPGPVVVSLPEDMLLDGGAEPVSPEMFEPLPKPDMSIVGEIARRLAIAERPLLIIGGGVGSVHARRLVIDAAEAWNIPVATSFRQQHLFPSAHPLAAGHLGFNIPRQALDTISPADLVIAVGTRLGDVTTQGYRFPAAPTPKQPLIHVHAAAEALNAAHQATIALQSDASDFLEALLGLRPNALPDRSEWIKRVNGYAAGLLNWSPAQAADGVVFGTIVAALRDAAPADAIITLDAGNFSGWLHRYFPFGTGHTLLAPISGAMGFGVPAGVAAALRCPDRKVITFVGDGGFLMTGNELATALQYGARLCIIVSDNGSYGTIRQYQERDYPGRVAATGLRNPDFQALGRAFGAESLRIGPNDDAAAIIRHALSIEGPVLVHVQTSLTHISAYMTLKQ